MSFFTSLSLQLGGRMCTQRHAGLPDMNRFAEHSVCFSRMSAVRQLAVTEEHHGSCAS